jgi:hypothetical protein
MPAPKIILMGSPLDFQSWEVALVMDLFFLLGQELNLDGQMAYCVFLECKLKNLHGLTHDFLSKI